MCNPAAAMAATTIISTGAKMTMDAQQAAHESRELDREAKVARAQGAEEERKLRVDQAREQARRRVAIHKGGITVEGSPTDMLVDAAREDDVAARWAGFGQTEAARAKERDARNRRRQAVLSQLSGNANLGTDLINISTRKDLKW